MSAFQCNLTPTRIRNDKKRNEDREPTIVDLRPFSSKAIVVFEDVPVTKTARRSLIVMNSYNEPLKVSLTKIPKPEFNLDIQWNSTTIPPNSQSSLELVWNPVKVLSSRETIQICDVHGNRKDVAVILKSCELKRATGRKIVPSVVINQQRFRPKSPSPTKTAHKQPPLDVRSSPLRNVTNMSNVAQPSQGHFGAVINNKENQSPATPSSAAALFDNFRFTPVTETKPKSHLEYLNSLSTPVTINREDVSFAGTINKEHSTHGHAAPLPAQRKVIHFDEVDDGTFVKGPADEEIDEIEIIFSSDQTTNLSSAVNRTKVLSNPVIRVDSEEQAVFVEKTTEQTFQLNKTQSLNIIAGVPATVTKTTKYDELTHKLRINQGSMPNLNDMQAHGTIEHNRYYQTEQHNISMESHADFREFESKTEFCAQSSQLNFEVISPGKSSQGNSRANSPVRSKQLLNVKFADKSPASSKVQSPLHLSPTMRRIQEEPDFKPVSPKKSVFQLTFSPPRKSISAETIRRETFVVPKSGRGIRATTWKQQQSHLFKVPKELKLTASTPRLSSQSQSLHSSNSSICSTSSMPPITSGRLYNENIVIPRSDPFSATTTQDPFLSSTLYLDERKLDSIEKAYVKWLNALVTVPADLETDQNEKIDVGKLFSDVQNKELTIAQTKEVVCSKYYLSRLDNLRSSAVRFYQSDEIATTLVKLTNAVNSDRDPLGVKNERPIYLDLVLQRSLLELLLCYNPLWLRIGLEIVFNVQLNLASNHDILGLTRFIVTRMFKSQYILDKMAKLPSKRNELLLQMRRHTVKHLLFVLYFLDRAKEHRLIKQNPCLFMRRAPYKDSNDILKKLASLVLSNYGDVMRLMKRYDFVLTHKQTVIDEYDYAFKNLAVDLRDGVRLTKVMEIILMRDDLVNRVRVPAISRLQKVHNVDLALKALEEAEYKILGDITAKDIADGHREKTLSLLWQIIYKFRAPKFNAAAKVIQKFWRAKFLLVIVNRRIRRREEEKKIRAATTIQRYFRGWQARNLYQQQRKQIIESCVTLQRFVRGFQARLRYRNMKVKVVIIQKWFRCTIKMRTERVRFLLVKSSANIIQTFWRRQLLAKKLIAASHVIRQIKDEAHRRHQSAIIIQRTFKSYVTHMKFHAHINAIVQHNRRVKRENEAAIKIQAMIRMRSERMKYEKLRAATICIQRRWRHILNGRKCREEFLEMKSAAIKIQDWCRRLHTMRIQRNDFLRLRESAVNVQSRWRANQAMKKDRKEFLIMKSSAIGLQRRFRAQQAMIRERMEFEAKKKAAISVQRRFRANLLMNVQQTEYLMTRSKIILIQRKLRATLQMRDESKTFNQLKNAAVVVQRRFRAKVAMDHQKKQFGTLKSATVIIQRRFRAQRAMKKSKFEFEHLKNAATVIQRRFHAKKLMEQERGHFMKLKKLTIHIQQKFRSTKEMRALTVEFYSIQYYTGVIQQRFRAKLAMRAQQQRYLKLKNAAICLQTYYRARLAMKHGVENYRQLQLATWHIQTRWRAKLEMRKNRNQFVELRNCVVKIQQRFIANLRCKQERKHFLQLKRSVLCIEQRYAALKGMRKSRFDYQNLKKAAHTIQTRFRANQAMKKAKVSFEKTRSSIIKIQRFFRGFLRMKVERAGFLKYRQSVVAVQRRFRARKSMILQRDAYLTLRNSTISIQQRFRANKIMNIEKSRFDSLKQSTTNVQRRYRGLISMRRQVEKFAVMKSSAVKIQRKWRATLEMRKVRNSFLVKRYAAIIIQRKFRAEKQKVDVQRNYASMKSSAIKIQRHFRGYLQMKAARQRFQEIRAAVKIQRRYRACLEMKKVRDDYLRVKNSAKKIQTFYRATQKMRIERENYMKARESIIAIQRRFRANQMMKSTRANYASMKIATIKIQRYYRGHRETLDARNQFLQLKKAVNLVENRIIANRQMEIDRKQFLAIKSAAIITQRRFRSKLDTRRTQQKFIETRRMVVKLQSHVRGFLARKSFAEMQTPERLELRKRHSAARKIQAAYRGYRERNKKCNRHFKEIVRRLIKIAQRPNETLGEILKVSIRFLNQKSYDANDAINFLAKLEYMSRTVPWILIDHTGFIATYCYALMAQAIRSEVDKIIIELCSCIILNLARYKDTTEDSFLDNGLLTIAQMLLRWCDKDCGIFNTLCTVVWVFAHCRRKKEIIRKFMLMKDGEFILQQIKQLVIRKENMRRNSRRPIGFQSISLTKYKKDYQLQLRFKNNNNEFSSGFITAQMLQECREMPSLVSDFGVVKLKPYIFYSSVFAFDCILDILNIQNIN